MTNEELSKAFGELSRKEQSAYKALGETCRSILPVLKDHNMPNLAEQLGAKLFELDVIDETRLKLITDDPHGAIKWMLGVLGGGLKGDG